MENIPPIGSHFPWWLSFGNYLHDGAKYSPFQLIMIFRDFTLKKGFCFILFSHVWIQIIVMASHYE